MFRQCYYNKTDQGDETEGLEMEGLETVIMERVGEGIIIV
jgi:hypothetical protein